MRGDNLKAAIAVALLAASASAINLDVNDEKSIKNAASVVAKNVMSDYNDRDSNNIPGDINGLWAEGGVLFDTMIKYWYYTGDSSYNNEVSDGMYWQRGDDNYFPANYSQYMANDDQMIWGLAAMTAAELDFPERSSMPSWITLAQGVFDAQVLRWDDDNCGGGMRWQIWPYQAGYNMKNALVNGGLFELSARLARYTNNETYSDWAEKIWDWSATTPLLDTTTWNIADDTSCEQNCTDQGNSQWSFNYGVYMTGAAYMHNVTDGKSKWKSGLDGLLNSTSQFFPHDKVLEEITCESIEECDRSQILMKGTFPQDLVLISLAAPYTYSDILPLLQASATAAAKTCTAGKTDNRCGTRWYTENDGTDGTEQQIAALGLFTSNLVAFNSKAPATGAATSNATANTTTSGNITSTSSSAAGATSTGTNAANVLACSSVGLTATLLAGLLALF
ncbi:mannan endo-1-6-alpha-mannosidase [Penicillium cinerascens]|uniref:Mannan endo-1,6-alpha-mannosidase n=1 Tax=Penicillium cinerascens TaxID=70096 RepID=A0A9W9MMR8_9EURO|nr:mannan endo-1-6-alpha-mannosidase [Penicillium cinerascens]KAJ5204147.1 mannan endo-1-6-alpha-mannosidase [Penicillium cinerascens]